MESHVVGADGFGRGRDCDGKDNHLGFELLSEKIQTNNINDNTNSRFNDIHTQISSNTLHNAINNIHEGICDVRHGIAKEVGDAKFHIAQEVGNAKAHLADAICNVRGDIKDVAYQNAINTKDIISSQKDCCCMLENAIHAEGDKTRALMTDFKIEALRDKNSDLTLALSQCKQNEELRDLRYCMEKDNANTTQIIGSTITNTLTSLLSGNVAK